jgi:cyclopropane fatty-acyl-phospholipid synthase-like methyltransferase
VNTLNNQQEYDGDYFERGVQKGISGYQNYRWMPELTLRMAHYMVTELGMTRNDTVIDFGCAKGFLVKALCILDIDAFGCDVSKYALSEADSAIKDKVWHISGVDDPKMFRDNYSWCIAKDVFEHIPEGQLRFLVERIAHHAEKMFVAVPLADADDAITYIIPEYDKDVTHVIRKSFDWWSKLFSENGWKVMKADHKFKGCKENWTTTWELGNGFYVLQSTK